jgi:hypothetical protein
VNENAEKNVSFHLENDLETCYWHGHRDITYLKIYHFFFIIIVDIKLHFWFHFTPFCRGGLGSKGLYDIPYKKIQKASKRPIFWHFVWEIEETTATKVSLPLWQVRFCLSAPFLRKLFSSKSRDAVNCPKLSHCRSNDFKFVA